MTKTPLLAAILAALAAAPALAGDPAAGEDGFKKCKACHSIIAPDGTEIQKGGKTGPNLWGIIGSRVAADPDFRYGDGLLAAGAAGLAWDEAALAAYVADPGAWIAQVTGDAGLKSKMSFKLSSGGEDVAAYLAAVAR